MIPDSILNVLPRDGRERLTAVSAYIENTRSEVIYEMELTEYLSKNKIRSDKELLRQTLGILRVFCPEQYRKIKLDPNLDPPEYIDPV